MLFKRNAISSLMLELDSDDLPQSSRGELSNLLAQEVVELVNIPDCAVRLINYEKAVIDSRGNKPDAYLMHSDLSLSKVLRKYYSSIYYNNTGLKLLTPNLSVSELMIMLGTFANLTDRRGKIKKSYENRLSLVKRKPNGVLGLCLRRIDVPEEGLLLQHIKEETAFITVLGENINLLQQEICYILGLRREYMTKENVSKITKRSKELVLSYPNLKEELYKRKRYDISLLDDVLLLESSGANPEIFEHIFTTVTPQCEFAKVLKSES